MNSIEPRQRLDSHSDFACRFELQHYDDTTTLLRITSICRTKVRTDKLQPVIRAASVLRTLMKDARGGLIR